MTEKTAIWTIPNTLSLYRLAVFPLLIFLILEEQEKIFSVFFLISLITDILDGWIARTFGMESELGAKLDSWADTATYIAGFWAVFSFKGQEIAPHILWIIAFAIAWFTLYLVMLIKFRSIIGLHTYSFKITAYLQGACMMGLLWFGFWDWLYYLAIGWGILACLEEILIVLWLSEPQTDVKGLFWVLRDANQ
ncbi:MAG: phosphatidylglycerophosphate synthase [Leptolyngbya sp.]|nr:MAG: phosphatidylglycerophosphate synthase [Leptolyngbya sp.]